MVQHLTNSGWDKELLKIIRPLTVIDFMGTKYHPPNCFRGSKKEDNFLLKAMKENEALRKKETDNKTDDYYNFICEKGIKNKKILTKIKKDKDKLRCFVYLIIKKSFIAFNPYEPIRINEKDALSIYFLSKHYHQQPIEFLGAEYSNLDAYNYNIEVHNIGTKYEYRQRMKNSKNGHRR